MEYYSPNKATKLIYNKGNQLLLSYEKTYNDARKTEQISVLKKSVDAANELKELAKNNSEQMQKELKKAKTIEDIEGFLYYYESIRVQSEKIDSKYLDIKSNKSKISEIGKEQFKAISADFNEYKKMYYSKLKFEKGANLLAKLEKAVT